MLAAAVLPPMHCQLLLTVASPSALPSQLRAFSLNRLRLCSTSQLHFAPLQFPLSRSLSRTDAAPFPSRIHALSLVASASSHRDPAVLTGVPSSGVRLLPCAALSGMFRASAPARGELHPVSKGSRAGRESCRCPRPAASLEHRANSLESASSLLICQRARQLSYFPQAGTLFPD